jgi:Tol biopolymer transport system component
LRFTSYDSKTVSSSLWEVAADGSNLHRLLPDWNAGSTCCGTWTANGKYFVFQATHNERSDLWLLREGAWLRKPSLTQLTAGPLSFVSPVPGREGSRLYVIGARSRGELVRYDQKSRQFLPFLGGISADGVAFSKDGKQIAYTQYPQETLWRAKADGTGKMQLTFAPMRAFYPHWSPDGAKLVFSAFTPGSPSRIYSVPASGGTPEPVTSADNNAALPDWSPTGEAIVYGGLPGFMTIDSTAQPLRILDLKTGQSSPVPGSDGMICARWSPDGRFLAALTNASDKTMLFDFARKQWRVIANLPTVCPVWASNSQYLYCLEVNVSAAHLFRVRMSDGKLESIEDLQNFRGTQEPLIGDLWLGLAPGDSPLLLRDRGSEEIYALDWRLP